MILLDAIPGKTHTSLAIKRCDQLRGRLPDLLDRHGLSEEVLIDKYLRPLLTAKETIFFQKDHFRSYPLVVCGSAGLKALRRSTEVYLPSEGVRSSLYKC